MLPSQVCVEGHDEHTAVFCRKIGCVRTAPESKNAFLAKGDGDDRGAVYYVLGAIVVRTNVVTKASLIPVQQNPVKPLVNFLIGPTTKGQKLGSYYYWQGLVHAARVVVVHAVCLLPTGAATKRPCILIW